VSCQRFWRKIEPALYGIKKGRRCLTGLLPGLTLVCLKKRRVLKRQKEEEYPLFQVFLLLLSFHPLPYSAAGVTYKPLILLVANL
jgi:hypothetical protein